MRAIYVLFCNDDILYSGQCNILRMIYSTLCWASVIHHGPCLYLSTILTVAGGICSFGCLDPDTFRIGYGRDLFLPTGEGGGEMNRHEDVL